MLDETGNRVAVVTVEAQEGVIPEGASLKADLLTGEAAEKAAAELDEAGVAYDGYMALDIRFEDAEGNEVEPEGEVRVVMVAPAALPEDADPNTLAVQHHAEDANGNVTVEEVATTTPVTLAAASLPSDDVTGVVASGSDVTAAFDVDSFSNFTLTWNNRRNLTIYLYDMEYKNIAEQAKMNSKNIDSATSIKDIGDEVAPDGYTFEKAVIAYLYDGPSADSTEIKRLRYNYGWQYNTSESGNSNWENINYYTIYFLYEKQAGITITDTIKEDGNLTATGLDGEDVTYTWYRSITGAEGSWQEVVQQKVTGEQVNVDGAKLNAALDYEAAKLDSRDYRLYYKVEATVNDQTYTSAVYQVPYYVALQNGGFEYTYPKEFGQWTMDQPYYWSTTANATRFEIGKYTDSMDKYGTQNDKPNNDANNKNFAELNADEASTLYQDVLTVPGTTLHWQLAHRARNAQGITDGGYLAEAEDTMYVVIMSTVDAEKLLAGISTSGQVTQQSVIDDMVATLLPGQREKAELVPYKLRNGTYANETVTVTIYKITTESEITQNYYGQWTSTGQWDWYNDDYTVPAGQYATRFFFAAGETTMSAEFNTVGNLIDEVWFSTALPPPAPDKANLQITKNVLGVTDEDKYNGTFSFTISGPSLNDSFTLGGDGSWSKAFQDLEPGTYTITEANPSDVYATGGYTYEGTTVTGATPNGLVATVTLNAKDNVTVTFTNTYEAKPVEPPIGEVLPEHSKQANLTGDGVYDLSLSVTGGVDTEGGGDVPINVLFVVDISSSMSDSFKGYKDRMDGANQAMGILTSSLSEANGYDAQFAMVTFHGPAEYAQEWTSEANKIQATATGYFTSQGTNYQAGIKKAKTALADLSDERKSVTTAVIFISDGEPNRYYESDWNSNEYTNNATFALNKAKAELAGITGIEYFYTVGVGQETNYSSLKNLTAGEGIKSGYFPGNDKEQLEGAFEAIAQEITYKAYSNVTIEDELTDNVSVVMSDGVPSGFEIVIKGEGAPEELNQSEVTFANGVYTRTVTITNETGDDVLNPGMYEITATYDSGNGKLTLDFPDNYKLEHGWTYEVHIDIKASDTAKQAYINAGYTYTGVSDTGTAVAGTGTHGGTGDQGFYSNTKATLTYTNKDGRRYEVEYDKPVVQLQTAPVTVTKVFDNLEENQVPTTNFQIRVNDKALSVSDAEKNTAADDPTYTWTLNLPLDNDYTFTESGYAVSEATGKLMDSVSVSGGITATPTVPADNAAITLGTLNVAGTAAKTVNVTNTYVDANGDLAITKTLQDMNKSMGRDATFQFKITNTETGMVWYRYLTFDKAATKTITLKGIPAGTYTVEEMSSLGYEAVEGTPTEVTNIKVSYNHTGEAKFENKSTGGNTPGDQGLVRNNFKYENGKWVFTQETKSGN